MSDKVWFKEPLDEDSTWARENEDPYQWLKRSTLPRAVECRRFLNHNLSYLPHVVQGMLPHELSHRWDSAFFELIVARTLQVLGADLQIEVPNSGGKRPDFIASFEDTTIVVEAVAPEFDQSMKEQERNHRPLLELLEQAIPPGWTVQVEELPLIGPSDTRKHFKRALAELAKLPQPGPDTEQRKFVKHLRNGVIRLTLYPFRSGSRAIGIWPGYGLADNTENRIRYAIAEKRKQVRDSAEPVLLAVHASGIASDFEDFDRAIFGYTFAAVDWNGHVKYTGFTPSGVFNVGEGVPTYAGVLAYLRIGFPGGSDPILYLHPRFEGTLPAQLKQLKWRVFNSVTNTIDTIPAQRLHILNELKFVQI